VPYLSASEVMIYEEALYPANHGTSARRPPDVLCGAYTSRQSVYSILSDTSVVAPRRLVADVVSPSLHGVLGGTEPSLDGVCFAHAQLRTGAILPSVRSLIYLYLKSVASCFPNPDW